ncbi:MAG TPA: hypothetical protein VKX17_26885 [Planctomycetota bacterium]|nr:hypothetical protein [Planctomycetota bacterium]
MRLDQLDDLDILVKRHERLRQLGPQFSEVRLSSYMESLLGVTRAAIAAEPVMEERLAVSV